MKNFKVLAVVALISIGGMAMAQDGDSDSRDNLQFSLKAGLNYSNIYNSSTEDFNASGKFGFAGGAFFNISLGKYLGLQPEVLFSQKGFKGEGVLLGTEYNFTRTTSYIDIPIQLSFQPSQLFTIVAGPQYSYLLSQKDDFKNTLWSYSQKQEIRNDNVRKNILGVVAGLDINLRYFVVGTRMGMDIQHNNGDGASNTPRYKNIWFQGTIGYPLMRRNK